MKTYEKPMAIIEKIEIEDVITASPAMTTLSTDEKNALKGSKSDVILFQW